MGNSIKKNFIYSSLLTTANYIFPLLTFPYVSRILGANNLGICSFIDSIVNYFILFSTMGIGVVGIREIASTRQNKELMAKTFNSLFSIVGIFSICAIFLLVMLTFTVTKLYIHKELVFFGCFKIIFNFLLIEWLYKGIEDFKYITTRSIVVKCVYVISVFIFVRSSKDYPIYYLLSVIVVGVNAVINLTNSRKHIKIRPSLKSINRTLVGALMVYGVYSILTSLYTTFNITFLGFATDTIQVGYYTTATRLFTIFIAIFSAFTGVMLPRMSNMIVENKFDEFKKLLSKSVNILSAVTIPGSIFIIAMSPQIVRLIAGTGYDSAILPMRIIMPLLFIIGYEQILVIQALMPLKKDRIILRNSIIGAVVGVLGNFLIVPHYGCVGSAIVWVCCEVIILSLSQHAITKLVNAKFPFFKVVGQFIIYVPILLFILLWNHYVINDFISLSFSGIITIIYFGIINYIIYPNSGIRELVMMFMEKWVNKRTES